MSRPRIASLASPILIIAHFAIFAGRFLVIDCPQRSDWIVVLEGDSDDVRLRHALELLKEGYGKDLMIDAPTAVKYGRPTFEYAQEYANRQPAAISSHLHVCAIEGDSTQLELRQVATCIKKAAPSAMSGLVVTSAFHSRRALSIAKHILPEYTWSVGAAQDPRFGVHWWQHREWAKTFFLEWQKTIWWQFFERWIAC
jgi:hypothetical protein